VISPPADERVPGPGYNGVLRRAGGPARPGTRACLNEPVESGTCIQPNGCGAAPPTYIAAGGVRGADK